MNTKPAVRFSDLKHAGTTKANKIQSTFSAWKEDTSVEFKLDNGVTINEDKEILHEARKFYKNLHTSNVLSLEMHNDIFVPENNKKLDDIERNSCEGELTPEECLLALKSMDNNKTPGSDGLPADFYQIFWRDIEVFLINALNARYHKGTLSISQVLSSAIQKEKSNKDIRNLDTKCKISQCADDTTLLLHGSELSLQKAFELLGKFGCISGLKVNCVKTEALWIGKLRHRINAVLTDIKIKWAKRKVKALGVWFSTLKGEAMKLNFEERKEKNQQYHSKLAFSKINFIG